MAAGKPQNFYITPEMEKRLGEIADWLVDTNQVTRFQCSKSFVLRWALKYTHEFVERDRHVAVMRREREAAAKAEQQDDGGI